MSQLIYSNMKNRCKILRYAGDEGWEFHRHRLIARFTFLYLFQRISRSGGYSGIYINFSLFSPTSTCTIYFIRFTPVQTVASGWDSIKLWGSRFLLSLFLFLSRAAGNPVVLDKSYQKDAPLAVIRGQFYNPAYFCLSTLRGVSCPYCTLLPHARSTSAFVFSISQSVVALLNTFVNCYVLRVYLSVVSFFMDHRKRVTSF